MATQDDQPRPDLDAALDAVITSLSAVSDEAVADSLRRTRMALADAEPRRAGGAWRWAVPAVAFTTVLVAVSLWYSRPRVDAPPIARAPLPSRPIARAVPSAPALVAPTVAPSRPSSEPRVRATSTTPSIAAPPAPDPLIALTRAVQEIPEDAWNSMARAQDPLSTPELATQPIVVPPLATPPIADAPAAPLAEGDR